MLDSSLEGKLSPIDLPVDSKGYVRGVKSAKNVLSAIRLVLDEQYNMQSSLSR